MSHKEGKPSPLERLVVEEIPKRRKNRKGIRGKLKELQEENLSMKNKLEETELLVKLLIKGMENMN